MELELKSIRQAYAEELRAVSNLQSDALVKAFATVSREHFLGRGPWQILAPAALGERPYRTTEDADPRHLYHNVLVAIDSERRLNNGEPSSLAFWFDSLDSRQEIESFTSVAGSVTTRRFWPMSWVPAGTSPESKSTPGWQRVRETTRRT